MKRLILVWLLISGPAMAADFSIMATGMAAVTAFFPAEGRMQIANDDLNYYDQHGRRIGTAHYDHGTWNVYDQHGHRIGMAKSLPDGKMELLDQYGHRVGIISK